MRLSIHCLLNLRSLLVQFGLRVFLDHNNAQVPLSTYNYITNCNCIINVLFIGSVVDLKPKILFSSSNTQFYESWIFCLFTFWVLFQDKSFSLISKYIQKCQYNSLYQKKQKKLGNTFSWGNWNSGFVKLGVRWAERDVCI